MPVTVYVPEPLPFGMEPIVSEYMERELRRISDALGAVPAVTLGVLAVEPDKPEEGMIVYANGANWNPGEGEGYYGYVNGIWVKMSLGVTDTPTFGDTTVGSGTDISPSNTPTGQLIINGNGYDGYVALDATGMHIGHNSAARNLTLDVNETTKLEILSSGLIRVGAGTDTTAVPGAILLATNAGTSVISTRNSTADTELYMGTGASTGFLGTLGAHALTLFTNDTNRASFDPTNGVMSILSGGIKWPAAAIASADANTLDDYEEGSWTPTWLSGSGAFGAITYDYFQTNAYVKVGRTCTLSIGFRTDSITVGTAAAGATITGLPFSNSGENALALGFASTFGGDVPGWLRISGSIILPYYRTTVNGNSAALQVSDLGLGADSNDIRGGGIYITT